MSARSADRLPPSPVRCGPNPSAAQETHMLIDVHAHLFTPRMMKRHAFWGPFMKTKGLTVGHFSLGTTQPSKAKDDDEAEANLLARMTHEARRQLMSERGVDKLVVSTPSHA